MRKGPESIYDKRFTENISIFRCFILLTVWWVSVAMQNFSVPVCPTDNWYDIYTTMLTLNQILTPPLIVLLLELVVFAIWFFCLIGKWKWLLQAHRLRRTWWLLVHSEVTLIRRFWLDEISHYLYVHWSNRNRIHVILFIDFVSHDAYP
jgi:hypothetical protein